MVETDILDLAADALRSFNDADDLAIKTAFIILNTAESIETETAQRMLGNAGLVVASYQLAGERLVALCKAVVAISKDELEKEVL